MYKTTINGRQELTFEKQGSGWTLGGKELGFDLITVRENYFHIIRDNRSYTAEVVSHSAAEKTFQIKVNGNIYSVQVKDKYDELLHQLGLDKAMSHKLSNIKAPMPGLVLNILVGEGADVKKGDALLVLEAMKMENILKSPADGTVKRVSVQKGMAVEKNQVLIEF